MANSLGRTGKEPCGSDDSNPHGDRDLNRCRGRRIASGDGERKRDSRDHTSTQAERLQSIGVSCRAIVDIFAMHGFDDLLFRPSAHFIYCGADPNISSARVPLLFLLVGYLKGVSKATQPFPIDLFGLRVQPRVAKPEHGRCRLASPRGIERILSRTSRRTSKARRDKGKGSEHDERDTARLDFRLSELRHECDDDQDDWQQGKHDRGVSSLKIISVHSAFTPRSRPEALGNPLVRTVVVDVQFEVAIVSGRVDASAQPAVLAARIGYRFATYRHDDCIGTDELQRGQMTAGVTAMVTRSQEIGLQSYPIRPLQIVPSFGFDIAGEQY
jgi:hypothetical protein